MSPLSTAIPEASWGQLLSGRNAALLVALTGGVVLHAINIFLATTMLPTVVADIGGLSLYAWNVTLFEVASIIGAVVSASIRQRSGVRVAYLLAGGLMMLGSALAAIAPHIGMLLLGKFVQGLGGGVLLALGYAVVPLVFAEALWPRALAVISGMWGIATLFGPALGGVFAEWGLWRLAFALMVPLGLFYLLFVWRVLPAVEEPGAPLAVPYPQLVVLTLAVLAISVGSTQPELWLNVLGLVVTGLLIVWLFWLEKHRSARLLPSAALQWNSGLFAVFSIMTLLLVALSSELFVPYYLQHLHGLSPLLAGYITALSAVGWSLSELLSARLGATGVRRIVLVAPLMVLLGLIGLARWLPESGMGSEQVWLSALALLLMGAGIGSCWPHLTTLVFKFTADADQRLAGSAMTTVMMFASALGAALAGMLVNLRGFSQSQDLLVISDSALWLFVVFALAPLLAVVSSRRLAEQV